MTMEQRRTVEQRRTAVADRAVIFGSNAMYAVLLELARRSGPFQAGELEAATGFSRGQVGRELRKLRRIGVVQRIEVRGRTERFEVTDTELSRALLRLAGLLAEAELRGSGPLA